MSIELPPEGVVTHRQGPSADIIRALDGNTHQPVDVHVPGELIEDVDGYPLAVGQTQTFTATLTARITRTDLHNAQLDEREVHRVRISS